MYPEYSFNHGPQRTFSDSSSRKWPLSLVIIVRSIDAHFLILRLRLHTNPSTMGGYCCCASFHRLYLMFPMLTMTFCFSFKLLQSLHIIDLLNKAFLNLFHRSSPS